MSANPFGSWMRRKIRPSGVYAESASLTFSARACWNYVDSAYCVFAGKGTLQRDFKNRPKLALELDQLFRLPAAVLRQKLIRGKTEHSGEADEFKICNPSNLRFDLRQCLTTDLPTEEVQLGNEHGLTQSALLAQLPNLRPDDVARAPCCSFRFQNSLDPTESKPCHGSEFRTL